MANFVSKTGQYILTLTTSLPTNTIFFSTHLVFANKFRNSNPKLTLIHCTNVYVFITYNKFHFFPVNKNIWVVAMYSIVTIFTHNELATAIYTIQPLFK